MINVVIVEDWLKLITSIVIGKGKFITGYHKVWKSYESTTAVAN